MAFPTGYTKYQEITIDHTKVAADLTDYVVYVDLANLLKAGADIFDTCLTDGGDIRATKSDGTTQLATEIVAIDTTAKTGEMHIKFSGTLSSSTDTIIRIYYNGADAALANTDTYGRNNVWTNYLAVWHLGNLTDSKGTYDLTNNSAVTFGTTNAKIGTTSIYNATNANYLYHNSAFGRSYNSSYSLSTWVYTDDDPTVDYDIAEILVAANPGNRMRMLYEYNGGSRRIRMYQNTTVGTTFFDISGNIGGTTGRYDITFSGSAIYMYKNGTATHSNVSNNANGGNLTGTTRLSLGNTSASGYTAALKGKIDETRYRSSVATGSEISTEYNNQNSPSTFYAAGDEQGGSSGVTATPTAQVATFSVPTYATNFSYVVTPDTQVGTFSVPAFTTAQGIRVTADPQVATFTIPEYVVSEGATIVLPNTQSMTFDIPVYDSKTYAIVMPDAQVLTFDVPASTIVVTAHITLTPNTVSLVMTTVGIQRIGAVWRKSGRNSSGDWTRVSRNSD